MNSIYVEDVADDSSNQFSRGRHFYKSLLLAGALGRYLAGTQGQEG